MGALHASPRQTAQGPAATRTLAAQGAGYKNRVGAQKIPKILEKSEISGKTATVQRENALKKSKNA